MAGHMAKKSDVDIVTVLYQHPQSFTGSISPFAYLIHAVPGTKFNDKFEL